MSNVHSLATADRDDGKSDLSQLKRVFPILVESAHHDEQPLAYLDSAATTQKPSCVINRIDEYYRHENANVHRGVYRLSAQATKAYETARDQVKRFINAAHSHEIIFTSGTTAAINLVASSFGALNIVEGDEIVVTEMEHHANIVPWQVLAKSRGAKLKVLPIHDNGELDLDALSQLLTGRVKLLALTHVSNVLGTINPVKDIIKMAHQHNIAVLVDGAQAAPHMRIDVQALDCDFYTFSSHKMYGPTGVGVLYGKTQWLERMPPYQVGGDMIKRVSWDKTEFNVLPYKFEAGTPHIAGVVGLAAAIDFIENIGFAAINDYEAMLTQYAMEQLATVPKLKLVGTAAHKAGVVSFVMEQAHPHDIGTILDHEGVAVRAGHHCAMPLIERLGLPATVRASLAIYNTKEDIDRLVAGLLKVIKLFGQ